MQKYIRIYADIHIHTYQHTNTHITHIYLPNDAQLQVWPLPSHSNVNQQLVLGVHSSQGLQERNE